VDIGDEEKGSVDRLDAPACLGKAGTRQDGDGAKRAQLFQEGTA
jgi:hypothetical protein